MRSPITRATAAAAYIVGIVLVINLFTDNVPNATLLVPMTMLSLFVLSAAVMGYLFLSEPIRLYFDSKRAEAMIFFGKTVGIFALFALLFVCAMIYVSR